MLSNEHSHSQLLDIVKKAMENYKILWIGKVLKVRIHGNMYLLEIVALDPP